MGDRLRRLGVVRGLGLLLGCALVTVAVIIAAGWDSSAGLRGDSPAREQRTSTSPCEAFGVRPGRGVDCPHPVTGTRTRPDAPPSGPAPPQIDVRRAVGTKIMTSMSGTWPSQALLRRVREGEVGGIIIFTTNVSDQLPDAMRALRSAARQGGGRGLIIAIDQEGGPVRRLSASPPNLSARQMGAAGAGTALEQGRATGEALREIGVNANLAPVADIQGPGGFLAERSFATSAGAVSSSACAFASGLRQAQVHATLKHFPGLGRAQRNTDHSHVSLDTPRGKLLEDIEPYRRCAKHNAMVMLSNAAYPRLAGQIPAAFNPTIIRTLLREQLGFRGVTISDALSAPGVAGPGAALRATRAGIDMLLYTDEHVSGLGYRELLSGLRSGRLSRTEVYGSARRIRALQE